MNGKAPPASKQAAGQLGLQAKVSTVPGGQTGGRTGGREGEREQEQEQEFLLVAGAARNLFCTGQLN